MCRLNRCYEARCGWMWLGDGGRWLPVRLPFGLPGHYLLTRRSSAVGPGLTLSDGNGSEERAPTRLIGTARKIECGYTYGRAEEDDPCVARWAGDLGQLQLASRLQWQLVSHR